MTLDHIAGGLWLVLASTAFFGHVVTARSRPHWPTWPAYLRWALLVMGVTALWRGVNLLDMAGRQNGAPGHANPEGVLGIIGIAIFAACGFHYAWRIKMPREDRQRLEAAEAAMRADPTLGGAVLPLTAQEAAERPSREDVAALLAAAFAQPPARYRPTDLRRF